MKSTVNVQQSVPVLVDLDGTSVMSNALMRKAKQEGMPIELLSFPAEKNMLAKIDAGKNLKQISSGLEIVYAMATFWSSL